MEKTKPSRALQSIFLVLAVCLLMNVLPLGSSLDLQATPLEKVGVDWDNVDSFTQTKDTSVYGKYQIRNSVLGIPFLQLSKVADIELKENSDVCSINCFAEKEIILYNDGILIDDIIFKTLQEDDSWIEQDIRNYHFSYQGEIQDYKTVCTKDKELSLNGTQTETCIRVEDGTHIGTINYQMGDVVKAGTYNLRLDGQKKPSRTVDWIVKSNGVWTDEWATWGSISGGDDAEVILNSPVDNYILLNNPQTFNATATITGGATLVNRSLWTNETGDWDIKNTTSTLGGDVQITGHGDGGATTPGKFGAKFTLTSESNLTQADFIVSTTPITTWYLGTTNGGSEISTGTLTGGKATIGELLSIGTYYLTTDRGGANYQYWAASVSYPISIGTIGQIDSRNDGNSEKMNELVNMNFSFSTDSLIQTWTRTITDGIIWNVQACDSDGDCGFATANRTLLIDTTIPKISLKSPTGTINYGAIGQSETLNVTFTDTNLDTCWYDYNGTNITIDGCVTGVSNSTNFTLEYGDTDMTIWANDSVGNTNSTYTSWDYKILENEQVYETEVYETEISTIAINITYDPTNPITAILNYDGTNYSSVNAGSESIGYFASSAFNIPLINASENKTFYWIITTGGSIITTTEINQTISPLIFQQCNATYPTQTLNFTFFDELNQTNLNASSYPTNILTNFQYWIGDGSIKKTYTFQNLSSSLNNYQFCINRNETTYLDMNMQYFSTDYAERTYYYRNETIDNSSKDILLYSLLNSEATKFSVNIKQETDVFTDAIVKVWKYFVGLGDYAVVMVGLTDDNGQFVSNLDLDQTYNFTIEKDNYNYGGYIKQSACASSPCEIDINIGEIALSGFASLKEYFAQNIEITDAGLWNNITTKMVSIDFLDTTGTASYWRLYVYMNNYNNDSIISICDVKSYTSSGTLSCNYSNYSGDIVAKLYISRSPEKLVDFINFVNDNAPEIFGASAILASIIILCVVIFSGTMNPVIALIEIPFALVLLKFIGFIPLDWSWIAGLTIFILWIAGKMNA